MGSNPTFTEGKKAVSLRLTEKAIRLISKLANELGIANASVVELSIRELALKHLDRSKDNGAK